MLIKALIAQEADKSLELNKGFTAVIAAEIADKSCDSTKG